MTSFPPQLLRNQHPTIPQLCVRRPSLRVQLLLLCFQAGEVEFCWGMGTVMVVERVQGLVVGEGLGCDLEGDGEEGEDEEWEMHCSDQRRGWNSKELTECD